MTDRAVRVLAIALRILPESAGEWGRAMAAELQYLTHPDERMRFACSCLFACSVVRVRSVNLIPRAMLLVSVAASVVTVFVIARRNQSLLLELQSFTSIRFAAMTVVLLAVVAGVPFAANASATATQRGAWMGVALVVVNSLASSLAGPWFPAVMFATFAAAFLVLPAFIAGATCSFRVGLMSSLWASFIAAPFGFAFDLVVTLTINREAHARAILGRDFSDDSTAFLAQHLGEHLVTAMRTYSALPILAITLGALGALCGLRCSSLRPGKSVHLLQGDSV
jgi:hypothetical protein